MNNLKIPAIFICVSLLVISCDSRQPSKATENHSLGPFEILEQTNGYIVAFKDARFSWEVSENRLTMNLGFNQSVTYNLNPTNGEVKNIMLEFPKTANSPGYWVSDANADGIPEYRRIKGIEGKELFIGGSFLRLFESASGTFVVIDGKTNEVVFTDGHWKLK